MGILLDGRSRAFLPAQAISWRGKRYSLIHNVADVKHAIGRDGLHEVVSIQLSLRRRFLTRLVHESLVQLNVEILEVRLQTTVTAQLQQCLHPTGQTHAADIKAGDHLADNRLHRLRSLKILLEGQPEAMLGTGSQLVDCDFQLSDPRRRIRCAPTMVVDYRPGSFRRKDYLRIIVQHMRAVSAARRTGTGSNMSVSKSGREALAARWVLPVGQPPVANAAVVVEDGLIAAVVTREQLSRDFAGTPVTDYGNAAIVPGLINLHTHLDYSALWLFDTDSPLFEWLKGLVGRAFKWSGEEWLESARLGARQIALSGTSCIADASYSGSAATAAAEIGLRAVVGLELFGVNTEGSAAGWQRWLDKFAAFAAGASHRLKEALKSGLVTLTVAPHAPYTVCPSLWMRACEWAEGRRLPVLVHVAESRPECEWIAGSFPEMDKFLTAVTADDIGPLEWKGQGLTPTGHLARHGLLTANTLAAHCVHLNDEDISLFKQSSVKVAHCPRSNARLRNGIAPLSKFVDAGLEVGLGTDSAASNDNLDLMTEARFALHLHRAAHPLFSLTAERALYMMTLGAARALSVADRIGSLEPGKRADIAVFSMANRVGASLERPFDLLVYGACPLLDLLVDGQYVVKDGQTVCPLEVSSRLSARR